MFRRYPGLALVALGVGLLIGSIYAIAVGSIKWDENTKLEGNHARLAGGGMAIVSLLCILLGLWFMGVI